MKALLIAVCFFCFSSLSWGQGKTTDVKDEQIGKQLVEVRSGGVLKVAGYQISGISNDPTLADSLNSHLVTEAAVKAYIDANAGGGQIDSLSLIQDSILVAYGVGGAEIWRDTIAGTGGGATDLTYTQSTRLLESSNGADVTLPLATPSLPGLLPAISGLGGPVSIDPALDKLLLVDDSGNVIAGPVVNQVVQSVAAGGDVSGTIDNLQIVADAVGLPEIAAGTPDKILGYNASGNPAEISAGSGIVISGSVISSTPTTQSDGYQVITSDHKLRQYLADSTQYKRLAVLLDTFNVDTVIVISRSIDLLISGYVNAAAGAKTSFTIAEVDGIGSRNGIGLFHFNNNAHNSRINIIGGGSLGPITTYAAAGTAESIIFIDSLMHVTIDMGGKAWTGNIFDGISIVDSDNGVIQGFDFTNTAIPANYNAGIMIQACENLSISNCVFDGGEEGIDVNRGCINSSIKNVLVRNTSQGAIELNNSSNVQLIGCSAINCKGLELFDYPQVSANDLWSMRLFNAGTTATRYNIHDTRGITGDMAVFLESGNTYTDHLFEIEHISGSNLNLTATLFNNTPLASSKYVLFATENSTTDNDGHDPGGNVYNVNVFCDSLRITSAQAIQISDAATTISVNFRGKIATGKRLLNVDGGTTPTRTSYIRIPFANFVNTGTTIATNPIQVASTVDTMSVGVVRGTGFSGNIITSASPYQFRDLSWRTTSGSHLVNGAGNVGVGDKFATGATNPAAAIVANNAGTTIIQVASDASAQIKISAEQDAGNTSDPTILFESQNATETAIIGIDNSVGQILEFGVGITTLASAHQFEMASTYTKSMVAFSPPTLTGAAIAALASPAAGWMAYNSTTNKLNYRNNSAWRTLVDSTTAESLFFKQNGNNFGGQAVFGTNDAFGVNFRTNATRRFYLDNSGGLRTGTLTDVILTPSDSSDLRNASGNGWVNSSGFDRLLANGIIAFQANNSTGAIAMVLPSNTATAFQASISGGGTAWSVNSTTGAESVNVGTATAGGTLNLASEKTVIAGSVGVARRTISASGTSALANGDYYIRLDATAGAQTITLLSSPTYNAVLKFKRIDNNPATVITFTGTVDGTTNPTSTGGGSPIAELATQFKGIELTWNGSNWDVTGKF